MEKENKQKFYANYEDDIKVKKPLLPIIYKRWEYKSYQNANFALSLELTELIKELESIKDIDSYFESEKLEFQDVLVAMIIGTVGSLISTNEQLQEFLRLFHPTDKPKDNNTLTGLQKKARKVLNHSKQEMDQHEGQYIKRDGNAGVPFGFHRLFRGHDILSWKGDNPFQLLINQFGFADGIKKAILHLLADTCSTQGLPVPLHSIFDVQSGEGLDNLLHEWSISLSGVTKERAVSIFNNMFTIHATDILGGGATVLLQNEYLSVCNFETKKTKDIFKIIVQVCNFIVTGIIGFIQTRIPKINYIALYNLILPTASLIGISIKNTKVRRLEKKYNTNREEIVINRKHLYKLYKINYLIYGIILILGTGLFITAKTLDCYLKVSNPNSQQQYEITSTVHKFYDTNNVDLGEKPLAYEKVLQEKGFAFLPIQGNCSYFLVKVPNSRNDIEESRYKTTFFMAEYSYLLLQAMLKGEVKYELVLSSRNHIEDIKFDMNDYYNFYNRINSLISNSNLKFDNTYPAWYSFFKEYDLDKNGNVIRAKENPFDENGQIKKKYTTYKSLYKLIEHRWWCSEILRQIKADPRPNFTKPIEEYSIFYENIINKYSNAQTKIDSYTLSLYKINTESFIKLYLGFDLSMKLGETDYMKTYNQNVKEYLESK